MQKHYARIAAIRAREAKSRVGFAVFIALTVWALEPSPWPFVWLGVVVAGQVGDGLVFAALRRRRDRPLSRAWRIGACASLFINSVIYSSIAVHLWASGDGSQMVFGSVLIAGALLHVTIHLYHVREVLLSAAAPPVLYFLALPILHGVSTGRFSDYLVAIGCLLYMTHLVVAARRSSETNRIVQAANARAQEERRRAEVASAAKSDFLAVVSHEIRTPMNAVVTAANLLANSELDARQREQVVMLRDASDVLIGLLNDVLDFSKIEAGKMQLEETDVDLIDRLEALERMWTPKAASNGVALRLRLAPDLPGCVRTDPLRLQQILFNLISNAVKFTAEGTIEIRADWEATEATESWLEVCVADTGCGIPEDRLPFIFDLFEQVDAGVTRRHGGTGLGLAITCKLAQLMQGSVTVESRVGEGSTFRVRLPMTVSTARPQTAKAVDERISGPPLNLLAADDHPVNRQILGLLLEPIGCTLTFAENGREAVDLAQDRRFDVILMDMQMPVMDGLSATRAIRAAGANRSTPVIAVTANAMDGHRAAWEAVGVAAFVTKPIQPSALSAALGAALDERGAEGQARVPAV